MLRVSVGKRSDELRVVLSQQIIIYFLCEYGNADNQMETCFFIYKRTILAVKRVCNSVNEFVNRYSFNNDWYESMIGSADF
jgi:hypothetical protein